MEVAIAGAGLAGRLLGRRLVQQGANVRLFEKSSRGRPQGAHHVSASMLAPLSELPDSSPQIRQMAKASMRAWPSILDSLQVPYAIEGSIVVAHAQDLKLLDHFSATLKNHGAESFRALDTEELRRIEPELSERFSRGLLLEGEGWIDNRCLHDSLESCCGDLQFDCEVDPRDLAADAVCDCRGSESDDPELRGVRGEVVRVRAPEVALRRPIRLMHPRYQVYISPRPGRTYVVGATEIESHSRRSVAVRSVLELLSAAFVVHTGFAEAEVLELGTGLRPAYPDHLPRVRWRGQVLSLNGLYRHGYLIGPAVVDQAMALLEPRWT